MPIQYFQQQPADRPIEDNWKITTEDWFCQWEYKDRFRRLFVPKGYLYDGASVPRIAWTITGLQRDGEIRAASLAHDAVYRAKGGKKPDQWAGCTLVNENGNRVLCDRREIDWVFREFMIFATIPSYQARRAWRFVRAFGWMFFGKNPPSGSIPTP
jgi:hypothetical protein